MISSGASIKAVQRQLGHASAAMTLDLYGHLYDDDLEALADALDKRFAAARTSEAPPKHGPNVVTLPRDRFPRATEVDQMRLRYPPPTGGLCPSHAAPTPTSISSSLPDVVTRTVRHVGAST